MTHEILTLKLQELDDQFSRLSRRIHSSQAADQIQIRQELSALSEEYTARLSALQQSLLQSRAEVAAVLASTYAEVEQAIQQADRTLERRASSLTDREVQAEEKVLLAEYALDFALLAANRSLLLSLQALDAQFTQDERSPL